MVPILIYKVVFESSYDLKFMVWNQNYICTRLIYINSETQQQKRIWLKNGQRSKRIKFLGINLPKETKRDLWLQNYKTLMKEIKGDISIWKDIPCFWIRRINIVKTYIIQGNLQIQYNPYQITNGIFHRTRTKSFTVCMEIQKTPNGQGNLEKEEWSWKNQPSWCQTIL